MEEGKIENIDIEEFEEIDVNSHQNHEDSDSSDYNSEEKTSEDDVYKIIRDFKEKNEMKELKISFFFNKI